MTTLPTLRVKPGTLTNYNPLVAKESISKIDAVAAHAVKLKNEELMRKAAKEKEKETTALVRWWDGTVNPQSINERSAEFSAERSEAALEDLNGIDHRRVAEFRKAIARGDYYEVLLEGWKQKAGLTPFVEKRPRRKRVA